MLAPTIWEHKGCGGNTPIVENLTYAKRFLKDPYPASEVMVSPPTNIVGVSEESMNSKDSFSILYGNLTAFSPKIQSFIFRKDINKNTI